MTKKLTKEEYRWNRVVLFIFLAAYIALLMIAVYAPQWYWFYLGIMLVMAIGSVISYTQKQKELQKT